MTPEERAEARGLLREIRRLNDERDCDSDARFRYVDGLKRVTPPLFLRLVPKLLDALEAAERERDAWTETAAQFHRGLEYYRGICDSTAPLFGEALYAADDGTRSLEPLRAKIPELVAQYVNERDAARAKVATLEALLEVPERKIKYLVADYPGDKESRAWLKKLTAWREGTK